MKILKITLLLMNADANISTVLQFVNHLNFSSRCVGGGVENELPNEIGA
jgi:hypothetical protein